ncbi:DISARM system helicase DrmA [Streptomyces sp. SL13]|uniref:DISARM system helicase DrmA n=1 Tax=Streptantibioticus silvisoli TaxID=2705255 RepID=A0AA90GV02_9ACTN|nr:DISARM system helicase DrmA [Streptantibioticus silvisoli]MDI5968568.1 DISARM system helicase DrmA [Streptantibioticus silvisoli]
MTTPRRDGAHTAGTAGASIAAQPPAYRLACEPDARSWTARENLVDILERELLGPANGPTEVLEGVPDSAYLIGRIAPVRLTAGKDDLGEAGAADAATDVGDAVDAVGIRGVPLTAVEDSSASSDEDEVEDQPQKRGLMIPASMGLRFQIPDDLDEFTVTASWGTYEPVKEQRGEGTDGETPHALRRYQRTPNAILKTIRLADLAPSRTHELVLKDKVVLRVDRYDDAERGCRLIEVAMCNDRETPRKIPVDAWLYQTKLSASAGGAEVFLPVNDLLIDTCEEPDDELRRLRLQYRDRLEFAHGRTCSVDWKVAEGARRASEVWTTWLPVSETPQTAAEEIGTALLDMRRLQEASADELRDGLEPIVSGYAAWLDGEERRARALPEHLRSEGLEAVGDARRVQQQLEEGLAFLLADEEALRCFRFMNRVMADQRVQSQVAERRAAKSEENIDAAREAILEERGARAHSWRTFQLAFVLMQLPLLSDPAAENRSGDRAKAQLLFFPTGGGKTEAYLGLAAYTFAIRRRQGVVDAFEGPLDGRSGVTVLMRYTLRLLTAQQFQRATTLVCAAELARREDPATWGEEPFRIGLWVGTDVSPKRYDEAAEQLQKAHGGRGYRLTVLQIQRCPWCGTRVEARNVRTDPVRRRVHVYCGDELADCPFAEGSEVPEGLPVLTVDEEIYRLAPSFVIATVDKFARLSREGEAASLFGHVARRCERHGFVHPDYQQCDIKDGSKHPKKDGYPAAPVHPAMRLRPPDLVIQDELHLITGALGTTVGLFEVAIDAIADWRAKDSRPVRPLLVASTATARNASDQVRALYGRDVTIFPPQVLDAGNTFFSKEIPVSEDMPGRRYVGISTTGVRLTTAEIRVAEVLMAGGQLLLDRSGRAADPYMSLVGYFSATRELAGMARYMSDDIQTALAKGRPWSRLSRRTGTNFGALNVAELTSRVSNSDITATLDQMGASFDPGFDSLAGKRHRRALREANRPEPTREVNPYDVVLATSMLQVGVDVTRLGLMLVVGQPKNTAEYIQASSRVGRDADRPGLVVALENWARPRDLAHFEQFRHYHATFYAQVEALSVTPFSVTSLERGLDSVLVSAARVLQAAKAGTGQGLSAEDGADRIGAEQDFADQLIDTLVRRIGKASDNDDAADRARLRLRNRLDQWGKRRNHLMGERKSLVYEKVQDDSRHDALMMSAENAKAGIDRRDAPPFIVANSMREVQPEINLLVSPIKERLVYRPPTRAPQWKMPEDQS